MTPGYTRHSSSCSGFNRPRWMEALGPYPYAAHNKRRRRDVNSFTVSVQASGLSSLRDLAATLRVPSDADSAHSEYPEQRCA